MSRSKNIERRNFTNKKKHRKNAKIVIRRSKRRQYKNVEEENYQRRSLKEEFEH